MPTSWNTWSITSPTSFVKTMFWSLSRYCVSTEAETVPEADEPLGSPSNLKLNVLVVTDVISNVPLYSDSAAPDKVTRSPTR